MAPTWREVVEVVAQSRGLSLSPERLHALIAGCDALGSRDAALDYLELEFEKVPQPEPAR